MSSMLRKSAKGQSMVIVGVVLAMGVLIGLVAIAVDGGSALLQRRVQQNAADSGVLAGIQLMSQRVLITGDPNGGPSYPTYALTDTVLLNTINDVAVQNRGGTVGNPAYSILVYYHYDDNAGQYPGTFNPNPVQATGGFVPDHVDGIRVKATVHNPTTFAKAIPGPLSDIYVVATAAAALYPSCRVAPPTGDQGKTLPFTRNRYSFEQELPTKGNNLCDPFIFWTAQADVQGPNGDNNFKNKMSYNTRSFYADANPQATSPDTEEQLLSGFDHRIVNGADMRGSADPNDTSAQQDVDSWIRYEWQGSIMTNTNRVGDPNVLGDWAEGYTGNQGQNVQAPLLDVIQNAGDGGYTPLSGPWPQGLNWGRAITRTVYLWGEGTLPSDTSAQESNVSLSCIVSPCNCQQNPENCTRTVTWNYLNIRVTNNGNVRANGGIQRVRFTDAVQIVFYENLNGGNGQALCPDGSTLPNANNSSEARGVLPSAVVGGPPGGGGGNCPTGWEPGSSVYYRQIGP